MVREVIEHFSLVCLAERLSAACQRASRSQECVRHVQCARPARLPSIDEAVEDGAIPLDLTVDHEKVHEGGHDRTLRSGVCEWFDALQVACQMELQDALAEYKREVSERPQTATDAAASALVGAMRSVMDADRRRKRRRKRRGSGESTHINGSLLCPPDTISRTSF